MRTMDMLMRRAKFLVVLDTMWGNPDETPRWFPISPRNTSGKRLYKITSTRFPEVWITNSCQTSGHTAKYHGKPDPKWLAENFIVSLPAFCYKLPLLICGEVARKTFAKIQDYSHNGPVVHLPHPAARCWTHDLLEKAKLLVSM